MTINITKAEDGKTILMVLRGEMGLSVSVLASLKKKPDGILLNGEHATVRYKVREGDCLSLNLSDEKQTKGDIIPVDLPVDILYCDRDVMVVNKPPFMPTHPSHDHQTDTLANALAFYFQKRGMIFVFRAVNRLDADTSGVVLIALHKTAACLLGKQMTQGKIRKEYVAILEGKIEPESDVIKTGIRRVPDSKMKREICDPAFPNAALAVTRYKVLSENPMYSCVTAMPVTGRTHQLRVHFASRGCPICGDTLYGFPSEYINRQSLHAYRISFVHPMTGASMNIAAPLPADMKQQYARLFGSDKLPF